MKKESICNLLNEIKDKKRLGKSFKKEYEEFYNNCYNLVFRSSFAILKNYENSEDVTQEVFTKIYKLPYDKFPSQGELSWIYTVTKNEAITFLRKSKKAENIEDLYTISDDNKDLEEIISKDKFNRIINNLPEKQKEIVSLKVLGDLSFREISKLLNKPIGTIQWHYYKAVDKLKLIIADATACLIAAVVGVKCFEKINTDNVLEIEGVEEIENIKNEETIENDKTSQDTKKETDKDTDSFSQENLFESSKEDSKVENITIDTGKDQENNLNQNKSLKIGETSVIFVMLLIIISIISIKIKNKNVKKC